MKLFLALTSFLCTLLLIVCTITDQPVYGNDPSSHIVSSAINFCKEGSFISAADILKHEEYRRISEETRKGYWQDRYSLSKDNELLPLHAALARILLTPFVCILGEDGVRLAMALCLFGILFGAWLVHCYFSGGRESPMLIFISLTLGTQLLLTGVGLNYDHFLAATFLLGMGFSMHKRYLLGGTIFGVCLLVRPTVLLFYPFVVIALILEKKTWKNIIEWCIGAGGVTVAVAIIQWELFGSPFLTFYHTSPMYIDGLVLWNPGPAEVHFEILISDWFSKLFDPRVGVLTWNPAFVIAIFYGLFKWRAISKSEALIIAGLILQFLLPFSRSAWPMSHVGNRYVEGAIFLFITLIASIYSRQKSAKS